MPIAFRCRFLSLLFALLAAAATVSPGAETAEQFFAEGNKKMEAGDYAGAIQAYNRSLELNPDGVAAYYYRAHARLQLKDTSGARADLALVIKLAPRFADAYGTRAELNVRDGELDAALADINIAVGLEPKESRARATRAEIYLRLGNDDSSISDLSFVIETNPGLASPHLRRGEAYARKGDDAQAAADFDEAVRLAPNAAEVYLVRADFRQGQLDFAGSIADAQLALAKDPKTAGALRTQGYSLFGQGNYAEAARVLGLAADLEPARQAYPLLVRHFALLRGGSSDERLASSWRGWTTEFFWAQGVARFALGQMTEEQLEAFVGEDADETARLERMCEAHFYIGLARLQAGDRSTARLRFQSAIATQRKTFTEYTLAQAELKRR